MMLKTVKARHMPRIDIVFFIGVGMSLPLFFEFSKVCKKRSKLNIESKTISCTFMGCFFTP
jgi:hypothetical protein